MIESNLPIARVGSRNCFQHSGIKILRTRHGLDCSPHHFTNSVCPQGMVQAIFPKPVEINPGRELGLQPPRMTTKREMSLNRSMIAIESICSDRKNLERPGGFARGIHTMRTGQNVT